MRASRALQTGRLISPLCASHFVTVPKVFKDRGSRQCGTNYDGYGGYSGIAPEVMQTELLNARIAVLNSSCGNEGGIYLAVCGGEDGSINIFEIPKSKINLAQQLGFLILRGFPSAHETQCR